MSELPQLPKLPDYSATGFVNREAEINLVCQRLEELLNRQLVEKRTFIFTGQHGIGKSWFLLQLRLAIFINAAVADAVAISITFFN